MQPETISQGRKPKSSNGRFRNKGFGITTASSLVAIENYRAVKVQIG
jgi:hypothetical protein